MDFIGRALALVYDVRLDLRKPSRLLVIGDMRVPRIIVRYDTPGGGGRLTIDATPRASSAITQDNDRLIIKFDAKDVVSDFNSRTDCRNRNNARISLRRRAQLP